MDIYQLRSFAVLAEHLHFGRAAQALHLSQPALTKQIRRLEAEIDSALFVRSSTATRLSSVGERWLPEVKAVLARFDAAEAFVHRHATGAAGQLRVGFGFHTLDLVPALVTKLRAATPGVEISLRDLSSAEQSEALANGQLDVGFMRIPIADAARYEMQPVNEDRLALVVPHRKYSAKLRLGDLRDAPFVSISRQRSPGFFNQMLTLCAAHGFHPRVVQEVFEFSTALALVRAGMGVAMIPQSLASSDLPGLDIHRLHDSKAAWKVAAVWRKGDTNPALANLLRLLRKSA